MRRFMNIAKSLIILVLLGSLTSSPVAAQENIRVVEEVRGDLVRRGIIPPGIANPGDNESPCKVFEITKRVAWRLRDEGAGLLEKRSGNNCLGYSMDWVVYQDGRGSDVAVGGIYNGVATDTVPNWNLVVEEDHGRRWKAPFDPGDSAGPPSDDPPITVPSPSIEEQLNQILQEIQLVQTQIDAKLEAHSKSTEEFQAKVRSEWAWLKSTGKALAKYGPFVLAGIFGRELISK